MQMSSQDFRLHSIWSRVRKPFVLPRSICMHDGWECYDMHLAGCLYCGLMHVCEHRVCPTSTNSQGHSICNITGMCTQMLNFSSVEYIDTVNVMSHPPVQRTAGHIGKSARVNRKKRFKTIGLNTAMDRGKSLSRCCLWVGVRFYLNPKLVLPPQASRNVHLSI